MKYIIEIPDDVQYVLLNGQTDNKCYTAVRPVADLEELNSDYINEHYGSLQDEAYQKGLKDGYGTAKTLVWETSANDYASVGINIYDWEEDESNVLRYYSATEAIDLLHKIREHKDSRIEVGDEVATETGKKYTVVSFGDGGTVCGFNMDGKWTGWNPKEVTKTGKHYDIQSILEAMRT